MDVGMETAMSSEAEGQHSYAILPYLKTRSRISLNGYLFRSTDDREGLSEQDSRAVSEISEMLFLQNSIRLKSGSYTLLPKLVHLESDNAPTLNRLRDIQTVLAYCYSAPHPSMGHTFLPLESSDFLTFTPDRVSEFLVWPDYHAIDLSPDDRADTKVEGIRHTYLGYSGYRNFVAPFWIVPGCRVYPSIPHQSLNMAQDLAADVQDFGHSNTYGGILELLQNPETEFRRRVLTATAWFNRTISAVTDEEGAIVHLGIAFESLLQLPRSEKTDRFVDAISLVLGRIPRLDVWSSQFYELRSQIAHEGRARHTKYVIPAVDGKKGEKSYYHPILLFGRQIFQACLSAIVYGESLARRNDLGAKLVSNAERFVMICKLLSDDARTPQDRLREARTLIEESDTYRYVPESGLRIELLLSAVRQASSCLLSSGTELFTYGVEELQRCASSDNDWSTQEALEKLTGYRARPTSSSELENTTRTILELVWHYTFMHYFWEKKQRDSSG
jgi:hypothetical protein